MPCNSLHTWPLCIFTSPLPPLYIPTEVRASNRMPHGPTLKKSHSGDHPKSEKSPWGMQENPPSPPILRAIVSWLSLSLNLAPSSSFEKLGPSICVLVHTGSCNRPIPVTLLLITNELLHSFPAQTLFKTSLNPLL